MADKDCEQETARLRQALAAETEILHKVQSAMVDGLPPDAPADEVVQRLWEAVGDDIDPGDTIDRADRLLGHKSISQADADSDSAIPVFPDARGRDGY